MLDNEQGALHIANVLKSSPEDNKCFAENARQTYIHTNIRTEPPFFNRRKIHCSLQHSFCEIPSSFIMRDNNGHLYNE